MANETQSQTVRRTVQFKFTLPNAVEAAKIQAEFKDGVLNVHLPKTAQATPKAIEVKVA